jgi:hypothetical protein
MSALVGDRSRYVREDPAIRPPDAIVISGDIIQGVPLGTTDAPPKIASQYATAETFIAMILYEAIEGGVLKIILQIEMVLRQATEMRVELVHVLVHKPEEAGAA